MNNFKCETYLFVADETEKYKDFIVEELENKSHFGKNKECVILIEFLIKFPALTERFVKDHPECAHLKP